MIGRRNESDTPRVGAAGPVVVVRPRKLLIVGWVGAVAVFALFVVVAVTLHSTRTGVYFRMADQVAMIVMGLLVAGGILLVARPRARADAAGIEVRNILVTRYHPWSEVERVAFPDSASFARIDLPADEYLSVLAVQAVDGRRAVDGIRKLRALHAAAHAADSSHTA